MSVVAGFYGCVMMFSSWPVFLKNCVPSYSPNTVAFCLVSITQRLAWMVQTLDWRVHRIVCLRLVLNNCNMCTRHALEESKDPENAINNVKWSIILVWGKYQTYMCKGLVLSSLRHWKVMGITCCDQMASVAFSDSTFAFLVGKTSNSAGL